MKIKQFTIEFRFAGKKMTGQCQQFKVANYPQVRVAVDRGRKDADVFTFYDMKGETQRYFWFNHPPPKEDLAKVIARTLENVAK